MRRSSRMKVKRKSDTGESSDICISSTVIIDLSESQDSHHGYNYCEASKHRSCWVHILALKLAKGNKWRYDDDVELDSFERISPCFRGVIPRRCRSKRRIQKRHIPVAAGPKDKLDSTAFHTFFRILWDKFPEDKKALFSYLDCLWFRIYYNPTSRLKVLSWIKKTTILSKKYVIVPVVLWDHWNLLIFCNFDESLEASTRKPCILLLDSLGNAGLTRYQPVIRKFVVDVFQAIGRPETKKLLSKIPFIVPKVPQQENDVECGNFVLYFIHLFVNAAPEAFDISKGHHNFINENWFDREGYENFCSSQLIMPR